MVVAARLKNNGELLLSGELNERLPVIHDGIVQHYPFDGTDRCYIPSQIRYVRDWLNGSTANSSNHWVEIQAIDCEGNNVALGKSCTTNGSGTSTLNLITDGSVSSSPYNGHGSGVVWVQMDLGDEYSLKEIKLWHYWADGRTYRKTKTEVSQDGIHWFVVFDSEIEGEYKETSAGKTIILSDNRTTLPISNFNTALTNEYIAVEEATINTWNGNFSIYNNYGQPATLTKLDETYMEQPIYRLGFTVTDPARLSHFQTNLSSHGVYGGSQSWVQDTKYVSSVYWRPVNKPDTKFGGTASNTSGWSSGPTEYLPDGWRRYYRYRTGTGVTTKSDTVHHSFCCPSLELNETIYIDICCPQTEEGKIYPTSYTEGSRGEGRIDIPFPLKPPYTINVWHKGIKPLSEVIDQVSSPMIFQLGDYHKNASISFWNYIKRLTIYIKGDSSSGWTSSKNYHSYSEDEWDGKEHMYTLVAVNNRTFKIYMDGNYLGQQTSTEDVTNITYLSMGNTSQPNARYRDLSLYDRPLSDNEIKKLTDHSFSVNEHGNLFVSRIAEKPNGIPADAIYLPLDFDASDRLKLVGPSSETNAVYEGGSVWVGSGTVNEASKTISVYSGYHSMTRNGNDLEFTMTQANRYIVFSIGALGSLNGKTLSISGRMKRNGEFYSPDNLLFSTYQQSSDMSNVYTDEYGRFKGTLYYSHSSSNLVFHMKVDNAIGDVFTIENLQVENKPFPTPFTESSRGDTNITYDVPIIDITKPNWTIFGFYNKSDYQNDCYFLEKIGDQNLRIGHWSDSSFAPNWGRPGNGAALKTTPEHAKETNKWKFFAFVRNGNSAYSYDGMDGIIYKGADDRGHYFDEHVITGWKIHAGSKFNGYLKDLCFVQRSLSDEELQAIFNTSMRVYKDKITLPGGIKDYQTL